SIYQAWADINLSSEHRENIQAIEYFNNKITFRETDNKAGNYARSFKSLSNNTSDSSVAFCSLTLPSTMEGILGANQVGSSANLISKNTIQTSPREYLDGTNTDTLVVLDTFYHAIKEAIATTSVKNIVIVSLLDDIGDPKALVDKIKVSNPNFKYVPSAIIMRRLENSYKKITAKNTIPGREYYSLQDFLNTTKKDQTKLDPAYNHEATAIISYTGGSTTGKPKGVEITNEAVNGMYLSNLEQGHTALPGERNLCLFPSNHATVIVHNVLMPSFYGATNVMQPVYYENTLADAVVELNGQYAVAAPSHYSSLLSREVSPGDFAHIKTLYCGGEPITKRQVRDIEKILNAGSMEHPYLNLSYGMSEIGPMAMSAVDREGLLDSVGKPIPGVEARIVDSEGNILGDNQRGLVEVKSKYRMKGYLNNPEATKQAFTQDNFMKTGDSGIRNSAGNYNIIGRAKDSFVTLEGDVINVQDIRNFVCNIEDVLDAEVLKCAVVKDGKVSYRPVVHIMLRRSSPGRINDILSDIIQECRRTFTGEAMPVAYKLRRKFPKNPDSDKRDYPNISKEIDGFYDLDENGNFIKVYFASGRERITEYINHSKQIRAV
ncbi:MAG: acyl--CoA ligase, partial [Tannerellaceae bacterium]|nr:acyl--CoA ligase [Tannerellaceae bacterium]